MNTSLEGQAYVITGATSGIGYATAHLLLERGATVIGVGRSPDRCRSAEKHLRSPHGRSGDVTFITADLAAQSEVRRVAQEVNAALDQATDRRLAALINNAAIVPFWQIRTREGFDLQWAVNHLAPFLLTSLLLPRLRTAPAARVVTLSSESHRHGRLDWQDIQLLHHYHPLRAYCLTKLANILFTVELNRRLGPESGTRAFAADPGLVNTEIGFKSGALLAHLVWAIRRRSGVSPIRSAQGVVFLATESSIQTSHEIYWRNAKPIRPSERATDPQAARKLWEISAHMCGVAP